MPARRRLLAPLALLVGASSLGAIDVAGATPAAADTGAEARAHDVVAEAFSEASLPADPSGTVPLVVVKDDDGVPKVEVVHVDDVHEGTDAVLQQARTGDVLAVQVDQQVELLDEQTDPVIEGSGSLIDLFPQWELDTSQTSFQSAWTVTQGAGQVVAVVDTGVYGAHEDLAGAVLSGADFVGGSGQRTAGNGTYDPNGHGTHVAGTIAARKGNWLGVAGAAPQASILPVRVLAPIYEYGQNTGRASGTASDVAAGVLWAADNGATVINLSLGANGPMSAVDTAINYATAKGIPVVVAAGNYGPNTKSWPAVYPAAIAVAATDTARSVTSFSSWSTNPPYVDVAAPGWQITSTWSPQAVGGASYMGSSGTSMAAPHVSAAVALIRSARPSLDVAGIRSLLEGTADDIGAPGVDPQSGAGIVDPAAAIQELTGAAPTPGASYHALGGARALDTRRGARVPAGGVVTVDVAGASTGVPAGATAAALNVTAVEAAGEGYLTVWPADGVGNCFSGARPDTSTVNYVQGDVRATGAIIGLGGGGRICVYSYAESHVLVDVVGYLADGAGDRLTPVAPRRLVDTRGGEQVGPRVLRVGVPGDAPPGTTAAVLNVTVTDAQGAGFLTVYPADGAGNCSEPSPTSNLNFTLGMTRANLVYATLGGGRALCVYSSALTHVIVDVTGYLGPNGDAVFVATAPQRLVDTRQSLGMLHAAQTASVHVDESAVAAQLNVTATTPEGDGFMTVWPCTSGEPDTSTVNFRVGETSPNGTTVGAQGGSVCYTSNVPVHVIVDSTGEWVRP